MPPLIECRLERNIPSKNNLLLREIEMAALDPTQWPAIDGLLRALTRSVLDAAAAMRLEAIEPYERTLEFAAGQIAGTLDETPLHGDPSYILGRIDGLLDACDMGIDRSVSNALVESARKRRHVYPILDHLHRAGETRASDLAGAVRIERNHLSNMLRWMEETGLVRRAAVGRSSLVSLGPKAGAVYSALHRENGQGMHVEDLDWAESEPAHAGAVSIPTAA